MSEAFATVSNVTTAQEALVHLGEARNEIDERYSVLAGVLSTKLSPGRIISPTDSEQFFLYNIRSVVYNRACAFLNRTDLSDAEKVKSISQVAHKVKNESPIILTMFQNLYNKEYQRVWAEIADIVNGVKP